MLYLDTSVLVGALTNEERTPSLQVWLGNQEPEELVVSEWVITEFSSALSIKLRTGQIDAAARATAAATFAGLCAESLGILPIAGLHFRLAARLADHESLGLRAGDALHLAVCADNGATLNTLDRRLSDAGLALGVKTVLL